MDAAQNESRWQQLLDSESDFLWGLVMDDLKFRPYSKPKIKPADLILDVRQMFDGVLGYSGALELIHCEVKNIIDRMWPHSYAYLLDWQHIDFKSRIDTDFEYSHLIDFPANGDYVFLVLNDISNVIFSDGIDERLYFFGEPLAQEVVGDLTLAPYVIQQ